MLRLLTVLFLIVLPSCKSPRNTPSQLKSVSNPVQTIEIDGEKYERHVVAVRGYDYFTVDDALNESLPKRRRANYKLMWREVGLSNEQENDAITAQRYSRSFERKNLEVLPTRQIRQFQSLETGTKTPTGSMVKKSRLYYLAGSERLYFLGCLLKKGKRDVTIDTAPQNTLLHAEIAKNERSAAIDISQVRWLWELVPHQEDLTPFQYQTVANQLSLKQRFDPIGVEKLLIADQNNPKKCLILMGDLDSRKDTLVGASTRFLGNQELDKIRIDHTSKVSIGKMLSKVKPEVFFATASIMLFTAAIAGSKLGGVVGGIAGLSGVARV